MRVRLKDGEVCFLRDSGERVVSADSVATCSATWFCYPYSAASANSPIINKSVHPIWSDLYCKSVGIKRHGEGAIITAQYEGSEFVWDSDRDSSENTVEVSCTMREEPIESHPDFERWAGSPDKPNCGIFDDDGKFIGWNSKTQGGKIMAGVKSYLVPSYSAAVGYISRGMPSLGGIGSIGGGSGLPAVGGNRQWMCTGISYNKMADGKYKVSITYLLSGPNGWNKYIYK